MYFVTLSDQVFALVLWFSAQSRNKGYTYTVRVAVHEQGEATAACVQLTRDRREEGEAAAAVVPSS